MRSLGPPVAAVLLAAGIAAGLAIERSAPKGHARIAATRTPAPGSREVTLDDRKYVVYYEGHTTLGDIGLSHPRGVHVRIESSSGEALPLSRYSGNFHTGSSHVDAVAILTVEVPRSGEYRIIARGRSRQSISFTNRHIVLGEPTGTSVLRRVAGYVIALLAAIGLLIVVVTGVSRLRE
jgi:hypothetical protein